MVTLGTSENYRKHFVFIPHPDLTLRFTLTEWACGFFEGWLILSWAPECVVGSVCGSFSATSPPLSFPGTDGVLRGGGTKQMWAAIFRLWGRGTRPVLQESRKPSIFKSQPPRIEQRATFQTSCDAWNSGEPWKGWFPLGFMLVSSIINFVSVCIGEKGPGSL